MNGMKQKIMPAVSMARSVAYRGTGRRCPCCDGQFRTFRSIGEPRRPDAVCPRCGSKERHRLLTLELQQQFLGLHGRVLHFAPEPALVPIFRGLATEYVTTDLIEQADVRADITELPFDDDRWDVIVCSHVLEHVPDDASAMRELRRVLAPGGVAVVMIPRRAGYPTDEDPSVTDERQRRRRFGQGDHVRLYGDDLEARLRANGFDTIQPMSPDHFTVADNELYRLRPINAGAGEASLFCTYSR